MRIEHFDTGPGVDKDQVELIFQPFISGKEKLELTDYGYGFDGGEPDYI